METDAESALDSLDQGNVVRAASEGLKTVGALDLGGSSLEVTFIPGKTNTDTVNGTKFPSLSSTSLSHSKIFEHLTTLEASVLQALCHFIISCLLLQVRRQMKLQKATFWVEA